MKKAYMMQQPLTDVAKNAVYEMRNTLICSYLVVLDMRKSLKNFPDAENSKVKANSAIPANIVYYIDDEGKAFKYQLIDSDLDLSYE